MSKHKESSPYSSSSRPQPLYRRRYKSNTFNRYSPKARLTRLIVVLALLFAGFFTILAVFVVPKLDWGKKEADSIVLEVLPTPNPTPNFYGDLQLPADIEFIEDIASWVKTDVYGQPVVLKRIAAEGGDVVMELVDRENVIVKGKSGDWYLVDYNKTYGYIKNKYVFQGPLPIVPEIINTTLVADIVSGVKKHAQLVNLQETVPGLIIEMELFKTDNYLGAKMYPTQIALLQYDTMLKLKKAQALFNKDGYTIVIWDAYRPYSVTVEIEELFGDSSSLIPSSVIGARNNRGTSLDMTIINKDGSPVQMPTDGMTLDKDLAARDFSAMTDEARANVVYMSKIMWLAGFTINEDKWWHFDDSKWKYYPIMDYDLFDF